MTYVKVKKETLDKAVKGLGSMIEEAEKAQACIDRALHANRRQREQFDAILRRAGLLRD